MTNMIKGLVSLFLIPSLFLLITFPNVLTAQNSYVTINLQNGVSFEIPKNWQVIDQNSKTTLDASVISRYPFIIHGDLPFAANLYNSNNQTIALMNIRVYSDIEISQNDVIGWTSLDVEQIDELIKSNISESLYFDEKHYLLEWYGTEKIIINKKIYLLTRYKRISTVTQNFKFEVALLRLLDDKNSFTATLSYEEGHEFLLKTIIDKIKNSIRVDSSLSELSEETNFWENLKDGDFDVTFRGSEANSGRCLAAHSLALLYNNDGLDEFMSGFSKEDKLKYYRYIFRDITHEDYEDAKRKLMLSGKNPIFTQIGYCTSWAIYE